MRRLALPLALLLVLSGCSGFTGQSAEPTEPVTTPAPVPTGDGPATERLAPGLAADGVTNDSRLARAHHRALENRSFTLTTAMTGRFRNGTTFARYRTVSRFEAGGEYLVVTERFDRQRSDARLRPVESAVWGNDTVTVRRAVRPDGSTELDVEPGTELFVRTRRGRAVARILAEANATLAGENASTDPTTYLFTARGVDGRVLPYGTRVDDGRGRIRAVVTERGLVRSVAGRTTGSLRRSDVPVRVSFSIRYEAVGDTAVERPSWVADALANRTETDRPTET